MFPVARFFQRLFSACTAWLLLITSYAVVAGAETPSDGDLQLTEPVDGPTAGTIINAGNAKKFKSIIVPELYPLVRSNLLELDAAKALRHVPAVSALVTAEDRPSATLMSGGDLDEADRVRPGLPFAQKDVLAGDEPQITWKTLWNVQAHFRSFKLINSQFVITWLQDQRMVRQFAGKLTRIYPRALNEDDKTIQHFREKIELTAPSVVRGFSWLTFRFFGTEEDMLWLYSPVVQKSRQLTGTNRSDNILVTSVAADDIFVWSGKGELVEPKRAKQTSALVFFPQLEPLPLQRSSEACWTSSHDTSSGSAAQAQKTRVAKWNYDTHRFSQAFGWTPTTAVSVPRKLTRIEMISQDPYSAYGRQVIYVDSELYLPVYKFVYNRSGYLWKIVTGLYAFSASENGGPNYMVPYATIVDDLVTKNSFIVEFTQTDICSAYPSSIKLSDFDPQRLGGERATPTPAAKVG